MTQKAGFFPAVGDQQEPPARLEIRLAVKMPARLAGGSAVLAEAAR